MPPSLNDLVHAWDRDFESTLPLGAPLSLRRPYARVLGTLRGVRAARFEPYRNDPPASHFIEKLAAWLEQFEQSEQQAAFLLASNVIFITSRQFENLLSDLYRRHIRRALLEHVIDRRSLRPHDYAGALAHIDEELSRTIFVGNSDSSPTKAFIHKNADELGDYEAKRLVGPIALWTFPPLPSGTVPGRRVRGWTDALSSPSGLTNGKTRLVILEDFSGSGSDLLSTLEAVSHSRHSFDDVHVATAVATDKAQERLLAKCHELFVRDGKRYHCHASLTLQHQTSCFDGPVPSYLDDSGSPLPGLSVRVRQISTRLFDERFSKHLPDSARHGFGGLALAAALYANCPDNSLPLLWTTSDGWRPLYKRVSRHI